MNTPAIEALADVSADGHSVTSMTTIPETFEQIMEQIDAFLSPLPKKMETVYSKLSALEPSFYTLFPKFKLSPPLYRWIAATEKIQGQYEIRISFVWTEYDIPRFGVLSYTAKPSFQSTWRVEFVPWASEGKGAKGAINWTNLYYVEFLHPLRTIERVLKDVFDSEPYPSALTNVRVELVE